MGVVILQQKGVTNIIVMQRAAATNRFSGITGSIEATNVMDGQEDGMAAQQVQSPAPSPAQPQLGAPTGEQPGSQQTTQGQMMTGTDASIDTPKWISDPEKCRDLQQRLILLLHAYKCQQYEMLLQTNGEMQQCTFPDKTMKNVVNHMMNCQSSRNCAVPLCSVSRLIINHWERCTQCNCLICLLIKQGIKDRTHSVQASVIQPNPSPSEMRSTLEIQCPTTTPAPLPIQDVCRMLECLDMANPSENLD